VHPSPLSTSLPCPELKDGLVFTHADMLLSLLYTISFPRFFRFLAYPSCLSILLSFLSFLYEKNTPRYFFFLYPFHVFIPFLSFPLILLLPLLFIGPLIIFFPSFLPSFLPSLLPLFTLLDRVKAFLNEISMGPEHFSPKSRFLFDQGII
jgi:hypothetical protein